MDGMDREDRLILGRGTHTLPFVFSQFVHIECFTDIHLFGTCRLKKSNCGWSKKLDFIRYVLTFKFSHMMDQHSVFCLVFLANFAHPVFTNLVGVLSNPIVSILLNQFHCEQSGVEKCDDCFFLLCIE